MRKRLWASLATVCSLALVATGCSAQGGETKNDPGSISGSVTMWTYPIILDEKGGEQSYWNKKAAEFTKLHPKVDVKVVVQPWTDRETNLTTAIAGGAGPDVVYLITDQIAQFSDQGVLVPAKDYLSKKNLAMLDNARNGVSYQGKQMAAPLLMQVQPLTCNKKIFDQLKLDYPKTYDDVLAMGDALKAAGYYAFNYDGSPDSSAAETFYPILRSFGGSVFSKDGSKVAFDSAEGVAALKWVKTVVDKGYSDPNAVVQSIPADQGPGAQGKIACRTDTTPQTVASQIGAENTVVLPPLKDKKQVAPGTVGSFALLNTSKNQAAAGAWTDFITSQANTAEYDKLAGFNSPYGDDIFGADDPLMQETSNLLKYANFGDVNVAARKVSGLIVPDIQAALLGSKTPKAALDDAAQQAAGVLK